MAYKNKEDNKAYMHKWYMLNRDRLIKKAVIKNRGYILRTKEYVSKIKLERGCADCGYNKDADVLDFDHLKDKVESVSRLLQTARSIKLLNKEIAKCEVVCANCHRLRTKYRRTK